MKALQLTRSQRCLRPDHSALSIILHLERESETMSEHHTRNRIWISLLVFFLLPLSGCSTEATPYSPSSSMQPTPQTRPSESSASPITSEPAPGVRGRVLDGVPNETPVWGSVYHVTEVVCGLETAAGDTRARQGKHLCQVEFSLFNNSSQLARISGTEVNMKLGGSRYIADYLGYSQGPKNTDSYNRVEDIGIGSTVSLVGVWSFDVGRTPQQVVLNYTGGPFVIWSAR